MQAVLSKLILDSSMDFLMTMGIPEGSIQKSPIKFGKTGDQHFVEFVTRNRTVIGPYFYPMRTYALETLKKAEAIMLKKEDSHEQICLVCDKPMAP